ncbi:pyrroloquinoline quinone biosynthesis protein PqqB [Pseudoroseomonas sp. WGS1072]|uniref:pyrroloquinoline quinone biosynthesis protein PqqB n=1 Tax=Roseomonas sp. WGS1072 TaxID=3366816 RepID=UPI003BF2E26B
MRWLVLGAAAGGGFPQWNCACPNCRAVRAGDPHLRPRSQSSLAMALQEGDWLLVNAAPELLQQIARQPVLHPNNRQPRHSPLSHVLLTGGEIDQLAGLLSLRERHAFELRATQRVLGILAENRIFDALSGECVTRRPLPLEEVWNLPGGARLRLFAIPGKPPLYLEAQAEAEAEDTVAVEVEARDGRRAYYIPACHAVTAALRERIQGAELLLFDGTVWTDDEMARAGVGSRTGRQMGHQPLSGADGSLAALSGLDIGRKVLIHVNNTNPVLREGSPERNEATAGGWEIAEDGLELSW